MIEFWGKESRCQNNGLFPAQRVFRYPGGTLELHLDIPYDHPHDHPPPGIVLRRFKSTNSDVDRSVWGPLAAGWMVSLHFYSDIPIIYSSVIEHGSELEHRETFNHHCYRSRILCVRSWERRYASLIDDKSRTGRRSVDS